MCIVKRWSCVAPVDSEEGDKRLTTRGEKGEKCAVCGSTGIWDFRVVAALYES